MQSELLRHNNYFVRYENIAKLNRVLLYGAVILRLYEIQDGILRVWVPEMSIAAGYQSLPRRGPPPWNLWWVRLGFGILFISHPQP
jgi:hypothetical protein